MIPDEPTLRDELARLARARRILLAAVPDAARRAEAAARRPPPAPVGPEDRPRET